MAARRDKQTTCKQALKTRSPLRRYGATVYAKVDLEWAGKALKALEHAPEIHVIDFVKVKHGGGDGSGMRRITMRSLEFPRFWEGTEVDLFGDMEKGLVAIYHPSMLE